MQLAVVYLDIVRIKRDRVQHSSDKDSVTWQKSNDRMGNYLPKNTDLGSCTSQDFQRALMQMGPKYAIYQENLMAWENQHSYSAGACLAKVKPSQYANSLLTELQMTTNPLHRTVLAMRLKHHTAIVTSHPLIDTSDTPQDLVYLLSIIGEEYGKAYSQAVLENCLGIDLLGKLPLMEWKVVFEGCNVTDILHQNILYNRIMDAASERTKERKNQITLLQQAATKNCAEGSPRPLPCAAKRKSTRLPVTSIEGE